MIAGRLFDTVNKTSTRLVLIALLLIVCHILTDKWRGKHYSDSALPSKHTAPLNFPAPKFPITSSDLAFGQTQVDAMMRDRPLMAQWVQKGDVIYEWAARQFAGESIDSHIFWSPYISPELPSEYLSHYLGPTNVSSGYISVRERYAAGAQQGELLSNEVLWAAAVFELLNIINWREVSSVHECAFSGKVSKQEYITQNTQLEFKTAHRTSKFYHEVLYPWAISKGMVTQPYLWYVGAPATHQEWIAQYDDPSGYPNSIYGVTYDRITAYLLQNKLKQNLTIKQ